MHKLEELINQEDNGWDILKEWISSARNSVEILPRDLHNAENSLINIQLTTKSLLGSLIYETGGLVVDNGWLRILGSGCERMKRSLPSWNLGKTFNEYGEPAPFLLIGDDITGGFYAINGGYLGKDKGNIYYFLPDLLQWTSLEMDFGQFLMYSFSCDLSDFYEPLRWENWQKDTSQVGLDNAFCFNPPLNESVKDINITKRTLDTIDSVYKKSMEKARIQKLH